MSITTTGAILLMSLGHLFISLLIYIIVFIVATLIAGMSFYMIHYSDTEGKDYGY